MIDAEDLRSTAQEMLGGLHADDNLRRQITLRADSLSSLPAVADEMLGGLRATPTLRHKILVAADRAERGERAGDVSVHPASRRLVPVMGLVMAFVMIFGLGFFYGGGSQPSGNLALPTAETLTFGAAGPAGSDGASSRYRSLFAGSDEEPPLLLVNGRYYRLLESPVSVPQALLGSVLTQVQGQVTGFDDAGTLGVYSNVAFEGAKVYGVSGLSSKTAVAAEVDGAVRLFQRVSWHGSALLGEESFEDTMDVVGQVAALELSGVGVVTDVDTANELVYMLTEGDFTVWCGSELADVSGALTVYLDSGLSLQLNVSGDVLSGCGAWNCPEFFNAFSAAL